VLVHALLAGGLVYLSRGPEPAPPAPAPPIEIEITNPVDAPAVLPAPASRDVVPSPPPPAPAPPRRHSGGSSDSDRGVTRDADSARSEAPEQNGATPSPGPSADRGPVDLSLGALSSEARSRLVGPAPDAQLRATPHTRFSVDELRAEQERQEDAVANVDRGRVDPVFYDYLRGARARFDTEARRLAEAIKMGPREAAAGWKRGFLQRLRDASREGERLEAERRADAPPGGNDRRATDLFAAYNEGRRQAEAGAEVRKAEVCLDVDPGKAIVPSLRRGSGNAALDRLAVDSFTRAIAARPLPDGLRAGLACYEVSISAFRMPPLPMFSCTLDIDEVSCAWPYKRITKVSGKLLSVDYARGERTASRSLVRRAR
jgi:hypothetical protein